VCLPTGPGGLWLETSLSLLPRAIFTLDLSMYMYEPCEPHPHAVLAAKAAQNFTVLEQELAYVRE
jgi:hypothetical protein